MYTSYRLSLIKSFQFDPKWVTHFHFLESTLVTKNRKTDGKATSPSKYHTEPRRLQNASC